MEGRVSVIEDYLSSTVCHSNREAFSQRIERVKRRGLWISEENYHKSAYVFPQETCWSTKHQAKMCLEQEGVG